MKVYGVAQKWYWRTRKDPKLASDLWGQAGPLIACYFWMIDHRMIICFSGSMDSTEHRHHRMQLMSLDWFSTMTTRSLQVPHAFINLSSDNVMSFLPLQDWQASKKVSTRSPSLGGPHRLICRHDLHLLPLERQENLLMTVFSYISEAIQILVSGSTTADTKSMSTVKS